MIELAAGVRGESREGRDGLLSKFHPYRLWSLWEMLELLANHYIGLGDLIGRMSLTFEALDDGEQLTDEENEGLRDLLQKLLKECRTLGMHVSLKVLAGSIEDLPETKREFDYLINTVRSELSSKLFLFVPGHRAHYHNLILPSIVTVAFPSASSEMVAAGNAFAFGLSTASVFHAMRAAELGVRTLANQLGGISFPTDITLVEWAQILDRIEARIRDMKQLPRGTQKDEALQFFSEAAAQFRYFKDGWRVRVAHARAVYDSQQARTVLTHTLDFFQTLANRGLRE